jgi:hypothetical protein
MSQLFKYEGTEFLEVTDFDKMENFIKLNKAERVNGHNLLHLFHKNFHPNPNQNKLDWHVTIGLQPLDSSDNFVINHFSPEEPTTQMFFSEIAKFTKPFVVFVYDSQFPSFDKDDVRAWKMWSDESGKLHVRALHMIEGDEDTDVSEVDEDEYKSAMEEQDGN